MPAITIIMKTAIPISLEASFLIFLRYLGCCFPICRTCNHHLLVVRLTLN